MGLEKLNEPRYAHLKPFKAGAEDTRTKEEIREAARKGGIKSGETKRKRKRMTEAMKWLMQSKDIFSDEDIRNKLAELGVIDKNDTTNAEVMAMVAMRKAAKGDVEALKFVRDTVGESPSNRVELTGDVDRPVATLDLRNMSEEELLKMAEARAPESGAD